MKERIRYGQELLLSVRIINTKNIQKELIEVVGCLRIANKEKRKAIFFEICETREEWEYLVEKLAKRPSDWRKKLIMRIQKNYVRDERAYLEMRIENLYYGMDYWDLVEFYVNKGDLQKALETAEQGILKGEGRLTELFQFLFEHFAGERDTLNVERIVRIALTRKSEEKNMLDRLFEYYKTQGN